MPKRSLESHLFREDTLLIWEVSYKTVQDIASSLLYLHKGWEHCVLHKNIKSSNSMLDLNFNAKLGDFVLLARLMDYASASRTIDLASTNGYIDLICITI